MAQANYKQIAENLVQFARKSGADQVQVSIGTGTRFSAEIREGNIENLSNAGSAGLSLKVIKDNKVATASSSDMNMETLQTMAKNAIERATYGSADEFSALPEKEALRVSPESLRLYDASVAKVKPEEMISNAQKLEKMTMADKRMTRSGGASAGNYIGESFLANSNGFSESYKQSSIYYSVYGQAGEDGNINEDGWWDSARSPKELISLEEIAKIAIDKTTMLLGAKKIETQKVPIVFDNRMASSILGFLAQCLSGSAAYMKTTFLADMLGKDIATKDLHIFDDGTLAGRPGSQPYDGEGVPSRHVDIIKDGKLQSFLLSTYSARKLGLKSTGHASGTTNFVLAPGKHSPADIIKSVDKGLYLTKTIGQGTVPTSGDISKGCYGIWIENGKLTYPVKEITFSGNMGSILKNIKMIGNDLDTKRSTTAPTILVEGMTLSGK